MSEFLSVKKVQSFSPIREEEAARVIQTINSSAGASAPINFRAMVNSLLTTFLSRAAFGAYQPEISSLVTKSIGVLDGIDIADMFPSFKPLHFISGLKATLVKMHEQIDVILDKIVKENQSNEGGENVVKFLLRVQQSSTLETPIAIHNVKASMWVSISAIVLLKLYNTFKFLATSSKPIRH
ncbi:hypothetical protein RIF29_00183 [Crotalaria pallida]|uniref:Uncharacterized protein n=1 Tax=Crotalaria pallida TaxID=3830 RepID=A0AAN9IVJ2_CROPI